MLKGLIFGLENVLLDSNNFNEDSSDFSPNAEKYELLMKLKACRAKLAVCAERPKHNLDTVLMRLQIKNFFDLSLGDDQGVLSKKDLYLQCAEILNLDISDCLIIDTEEACSELSGLNTVAVENFSELNYNFISDLIKIQKISNSVIDLLDSFSELSRLKNNQDRDNLEIQ